jgi:hypothetical protein
MDKLYYPRPCLKSLLALKKVILRCGHCAEWVSINYKVKLQMAFGYETGGQVGSSNEKRYKMSEDCPFKEYTHIFDTYII